MAEIPVRKKSNNWLWILLVLLLLGALVWWMFAEEDENEINSDDAVAAQMIDADAETNGSVATGDNSDAANADGMNSDAMNDGAVLTSIAMIAGSPDMIGRSVKIDNIAVNELVGDEAFTIGDGNDETLVMFNERPTPNTPMEGHVDVNTNSRVAITGTVRKYTGDVPPSVSRDIASNSKVFIFADTVRVLD